jgi:enoyl-CoA hydratase/carnithine racemase
VGFETLRLRQEGAVLFANISAPPMNLLGTELVRDLVSLIQRAEGDSGCPVLVFASTDPDYFLSHVDVTRISEYRVEAAKLTGEPPLGLLFRYLSTSRLVTVAQIEGSPRFPPAAAPRPRIGSMPSGSRRPRTSVVIRISSWSGRAIPRRSAG